MRLFISPLIRNILSLLPVPLLFSDVARAQNLNEIGATLLSATTTNLNGAGLRVAQAEAEVATNAWEVDPTPTGQPVSKFSYFSSSGSSTTYPNTVGTNSWHAGFVADDFYSISSGIATNIGHIDNYEADYFYNSIVNGAPPSNINDSIANQSFIFSGVTVSQQQGVDSAYDNYAVNYKTLFVDGIGDGNEPIDPPGTAYNSIGVGVYPGSSSYGPTADDGRCKPDITAPGGATSYSAPYVAGAAAILLQAALRGDGGSDTNSAADIRTLKALLLNGAVKPADWTNATFSPLDLRYGAGVVNVFNSYRQLAGGKHSYVVSTSVTSGNPHPPTGAAGTVGSLNAWDFNTITSSSGGLLSSATDGINHYYLNATNGTSNAVFTVTATLAWNRPASASSSVHASINNLALFLYNAANSNVVMVSTSIVDNVQHIFVPHLAPGRYDLQVWKAGSSGFVTSSETYALAWAIAPVSFESVQSGTNLTLSWPIYPAGFEIQSTPNLTTTPWSTSIIPSSTIVNGTNEVQIPMTNSTQFFRLYEPNF